MRIILADHHAEPCLALKTLLEVKPEFDLIGEAVNAQGLLVLANESTADLILLDSRLPGISMVDLIARLREIDPKLIVVVMSGESEQSRAMLRAGADAFVSKGDEPDWLIEVLHKYANQVKLLKEEANRNH
jgi:DNA-binding NarL/FixJ family response regulator